MHYTWDNIQAVLRVVVNVRQLYRRGLHCLVSETEGSPSYCQNAPRFRLRLFERLQ